MAKEPHPCTKHNHHPNDGPCFTSAQVPQGVNPFLTGKKPVVICYGPGCTFGTGGVVHGALCPLRAQSTT